MCNAYSLTASRREIVGLVRVLAEQAGVTVRGDLPEIRPRYRVGPRQWAPIFRFDADGRLDVVVAQWGLVPVSGKEPPRYLMTNARADKLAGGWPWKMFSRRQRCLVPADGFFEPEKKARARGTVPWSYYGRRDRRLFVMAGLWSEIVDGSSGEVLTTYTVVTTEASPVIRVHDRMPVILDVDQAPAWLHPGDIPEALLAPCPADALEGWRVADAARNSRSPDGPDLIAPVAADPPAQAALL